LKGLNLVEQKVNEMVSDKYEEEKQDKKVGVKQSNQ